MVFVADDLGAWLVGLLADAGRKRLTALVVGSDQERALRQAATAAVQATAEVLSPSDAERTAQIAMVISEVFREPMPDAPLSGSVTLLEGLQAGITRQLAVLDDPDVTGTGQSSADVLGVPGTVLAEKLTDHLVREITRRGAGGGPLTPLADQLNHDMTHIALLDQWQDRYTWAVEQLGSDKLDVRIGGIYALEQVARDSAGHHPEVVELLTAFVREHSRAQWPLSADDEPGVIHERERVTRPDVQAAITVIGRRDPRYDRQRLNLRSANLTGAALSGAMLGAANLDGANFTKANLIGAIVKGSILDGANLTGAMLIAADLSNALLRNAALRGANLAGADLTGAVLRGSDLCGATLDHADLTNADLSDAKLIGADLSGVISTINPFLFHDRSGAQVAESSAIRSDPAPPTGANLSHAKLYGTDLTDARLASAGLGAADLPQATLRDADLREADLTYADLRDADLRGADLRDANFRGADLTNADLTEVVFTTADLDKRSGVHFDPSGGIFEADDTIQPGPLTGTDFSHFFSGANLNGARWPGYAPVPVGWKPDTVGRLVAGEH